AARRCRKARRPTTPPTRAAPAPSRPRRRWRDQPDGRRMAPALAGVPPASSGQATVALILVAISSCGLFRGMSFSGRLDSCASFWGYREGTPMDPSTALQTVRGWPVEDRLDFVFQLWDQLVEDGWQPE